MLDPNRYSLDAATVGFRKRNFQEVDWGAFSLALQQQSDTIKVRRELQETSVNEVHVMGGQLFGIGGNEKTNTYARQQRQMNGYPLRSFLASGGPIVLPPKHGEGLMALPMNVGLSQYTQYNAIVGNYVSSFVEPLNAPLESNTILQGRAGISARNESVSNPYKALQYSLNMHSSQAEIQANQAQHLELKGYNKQSNLRDSQLAQEAALKKQNDLIAEEKAGTLDTNTASDMVPTTESGQVVSSKTSNGVDLKKGKQTKYKKTKNFNKKKVPKNTREEEQSNVNLTLPGAVNDQLSSSDVESNKRYPIGQGESDDMRSTQNDVAKDDQWDDSAAALAAKENGSSGPSRYGTNDDFEKFDSVQGMRVYREEEVGNAINTDEYRDVLNYQDVLLEENFSYLRDMSPVGGMFMYTPTPPKKVPDQYEALEALITDQAGSAQDKYTPLAPPPPPILDVETVAHQRMISTLEHQMNIAHGAQNTPPIFEGSATSHSTGGFASRLYSSIKGSPDSFVNLFSGSDGNNDAPSLAQGSKPLHEGGLISPRGNKTVKSNVEKKAVQLGYKEPTREQKLTVWQQQKATDKGIKLSGAGGAINLPSTKIVPSRSLFL